MKIVDWAADIINWFIEGSGDVLDIINVAKSGVPDNLTRVYGDIDVSLRHTSIDWYYPGRAKYWLETKLTRKTFTGDQIIVKASEGLDFSFNGKPMTYSAELGGYTLSSKLSFPVGKNYKITLKDADTGDESDFYLDIDGFSVPRDEKGKTDKSAFSRMSAIEQQAILETDYGFYYEPSRQSGLSIKRKDKKTEFLDNYWHLATATDPTGHLYLENPTSVDKHIFVYSEISSNLVLQSVWKKNHNYSTLPNGIYLKLMKVTESGETVAYCGSDRMSDNDKLLPNGRLIFVNGTESSRKQDEDTWSRTFNYYQDAELAEFVDDAVSIYVVQCDSDGDEIRV